MIDTSTVSWVDEDGIVHIRNSERGTLNKCPQRWWWSWRDGLRPKEEGKALWFGTGVHLALAHYYGKGKKRNKDMIDLWREFTKDHADSVRVAVGGLDEDAHIDAVLLGEQMLLNYMKEYQGDKDWDVIGTEQSFEVTIPWLKPKQVRRLGMAGVPWETAHFIFNGTFDGVYRDKRDGKVKLMEHKTAASIWEPYIMDNQAGAYWLVAQTVGIQQGWLRKDEAIRDIMYNFLRKGLPDDRPMDAHGYATNKPGKNAYIAALEASGHEFPANSRGTVQYPTVAGLADLAAAAGITVLGERSKRQSPPLFARKPVHLTSNHRRAQLRRIQDDVTVMAMYVAGQLPVTKSSGRDTCPMCPFKDMCELHESGSDWQSYRDHLFRTEDLYAEHRKSA